MALTFSQLVQLPCQLQLEVILQHSTSVTTAQQARLISARMDFLRRLLFNYATHSWYNYRARSTSCDTSNYPIPWDADKKQLGEAA